MKKKWKIVLAVLICLLAAAGGIAALLLVRGGRTDAMVKQQNYVASKLMEMGDYEQGRTLAAQCNQLKENITSKELMVLAAGFQADFETGIRYSNQYLGQENDEVISSAREIFQNFIEAEQNLDEADYESQCAGLKESVRQELLTLLLRVQDSIKVEKNSESIQAMLALLTENDYQMISESLRVLEADSSAASLKAQAVYAIQTGDSATAVEKAQKLYSGNHTFESRALLANAAAAYSGYTDGEDSEIQTLNQKLSDLYGRLSELEARYAETASEAEKQKLETSMEGVQTNISETQEKINRIPVLRAINFIEITTPITEKNTTSYQIELAQLYYRAGDEKRAKKLLMDIFIGGNNGADTMSVLTEDFLEAYLASEGKRETPSYLDMAAEPEVFWNRIAALLGFVDTSYSEDGQGSFYGFVLGVLDQIYNGIIIREIDATDFPTVRVTVNVVAELEESLKKDNFTVTEMGEPLSDFELLDINEQETESQLSVALVVDKSGSMSGSRMEDTQRAVSNFVKNTDTEYNIGLITFDSSARTESSLTKDKNTILRSVQNVAADGGTSIFQGLWEAAAMLKNAGGRRIVILLSDGEDGDAGRIEEVLEELNRCNIYVYTIGVGGADTEYLSYIASRCGGKFIHADSSSELGEIYSAIGQYMANDYVIQFTVETEPENYTRVVNAAVDVNHAFAEQAYHVGVSYEDIMSEEGKIPMADYFKQIGGSAMDGQ